MPHPGRRFIRTKRDHTAIQGVYCLLKGNGARVRRWMILPKATRTSSISKSMFWRSLISRELANALMEQMDGGAESDEDEDGFDDGDADDADEGGEDGDEDEDEDDEETLGKKAKIRQFASEIKQLEAAIDKKRAGFQGGNPIMIVSPVLGAMS
jgi:hypothetical protein